MWRISASELTGRDTRCYKTPQFSDSDISTELIE